jgi:hypothetical protein
MTIAQKVKLVASVQETYDLALALAAVDLAKSTWYYHQRDKVSRTDDNVRKTPV